jgi:hypothetical protein
MAINEIFEESVIGSSTLVKLAGAFLVGLMILGGLISGTANAQDRSYTFSFTENPHDADTITLNNHIFEFDSGDGVSAGHIPVQIGAKLADSVNNWKTAATSAGFNAEYNTQ